MFFFFWLTSDKRPATTAPADPPPTTIKSYSVSKATRLFGRLHGSSISHWDLMNTSNSPMNTINAVPPHALAKVGPGSVAGQLQLIVACKVKICDYWVENWRWDEFSYSFCLNDFFLHFGASSYYTKCEYTCNYISRYRIGIWELKWVKLQKYYLKIEKFNFSIIVSVILYDLGRI